MQKTSLIGHIIEAYSEFAENSGVPADVVLRRFFFNRKYLGSGDRRAIASAYYGAIKNFLRLEAIAHAAFESEEHFPEIVIAAYYIVFENEPARDIATHLANLSNSFKKKYP